ncbi:MAG TPA: hypothetical protein VNZ06_11365, partial [Steroidobacteraceae bacterium]|nr:hypothetical protein [Steroidobacteraceae bacterium]
MIRGRHPRAAPLLLAVAASEGATRDRPDASLVIVIQLYPAIEPYEHGMLEVGDGNRVYWEICGNPRGKVAVVLHGGPGSGCTMWHRRLFDSTVYRVVLFD